MIYYEIKLLLYMFLFYINACTHMNEETICIYVFIYLRRLIPYTQNCGSCLEYCAKRPKLKLSAIEMAERNCLHDQEHQTSNSMLYEILEPSDLSSLLEGFYFIFSCT
jgi:hypothetical protein